jgi:hypothetical protein
MAPTEPAMEVTARVPISNDLVSRPGTDVLDVADAEDVEPVELKKWRAGAPDPKGPSPAGTRVDALPHSTLPAPLDIDELRGTLEEASQLLRTVKHQASSLDLDLVAPAARGMNAQLTAALHRLAEALAMLGR